MLVAKANGVGKIGSCKEDSQKTVAASEQEYEAERYNNVDVHCLLLTSVSLELFDFLTVEDVD